MSFSAFPPTDPRCMLNVSEASAVAISAQLVLSPAKALHSQGTTPQRKNGKCCRIGQSHCFQRMPVLAFSASYAENWT